MSLELIMNKNGQLDHSGSSAISGGKFTITSSPSAKSKLGGSGIYLGTLKYTFSGGSSSGFASGSIASAGPQEIRPTAIKAKADGQAVIRLGDSGVMACTGTTTDVPPKTSPISGGVEVADAGQAKAKGQ